VFAVSAAMLLAACGSSSSKPASQASTASTSAAASTTSSGPASTTAAARNFDSCSVVTQADASNAIGEAVTAGVLGNATVEGGRACVFYGPSAAKPRNPNLAQADSVRVVVVKGPRAMSFFHDYKSKVHSVPVSGYGDQAFYDGFASLSVLKGDVYLRIAVVPAPAPPSLADEKKLAAAVLPKL
jgi:hypothetical protein